MDLNPGIRRSDGLFWTAILSPDDVTCDLGAGTATMQVTEIHVKNYYSIPNALFGGGPMPVPAVLSFRAVWNCQTPIPDPNIPSEQYRGDSFKVGGAKMWWKARVGDLDYESGPISDSSSDFAELGHERNGSYFS